MPQFPPILFSLTDGWALGKTVEASDADDACRKAAAAMLELTLPEAEEMFEQGELEVVAVLKGNPQYEHTKRTPVFSGFGSVDTSSQLLSTGRDRNQSTQPILAGANSNLSQCALSLSVMLPTDSVVSRRALWITGCFHSC